MDDLAFLVKWTGFDSKENTWEPLENVIMCEKFENYLNKYLVPTIGKRRRGRKENISFEFIEPKANHCYYLKDLRGSDESFLRLDDSDVQDDDEFVPPPPKKAKLNKKYAAIRSPKVVIPKRPKKNVESNAASFALHNLLNDDNFVYNDGN
uniref:Chromo domain-containing protein n=1 Tax=Panagrolaimus sp. ES5 TaxID=591445 RepID=A0AC34GHW9_9BILA